MANPLNSFIKNGINVGRLNLSIGRPVPQPLGRPTVGPTITYRVNSRLGVFAGGGINLSRDTSIGGGLKINF